MNVSTSEPKRLGLFDVSGIDWDDDDAIDQAAQLIWAIATTGGQAHE